MGRETYDDLSVLARVCRCCSAVEYGESSITDRCYCSECHGEKSVIFDILAGDSAGDADLAKAVEGCISGDFEIAYPGSALCINCGTPVANESFDSVECT